MPEHEIQLSDADLEVLEQVRRQHGLESIEQAAEVMAKARLRRAAQASTGRSRALHVVHSAPKGHRS